MGNLLRALFVIILVALLLLGAWMLYDRLIPRDGIRIDPLPNLPDLVPEPTPTIYASPATVVQQVQSLSRLETASYVVEKVITAETGQGPLGFLFGDRVLLVAYGEVIAGVDLGRFGMEDVQVTPDGVLYLHLPPAEVFIATLDNSRTYVYDRDTGLVGTNADLETAARQEAERLVLEAALEDGILLLADENGRDFLRSLFLGVGFEQVIFVDVLPTPVPAAPTPIPTSQITLTPAP
ncbi:MAG: DUF4230 domain-containing protein [Anaerolineales bacterium]